MDAAPKLTKREIGILVNEYIGVSGGYLGDFSYRTHAEFYGEFCDLDYDPNEIPEHVAKTTRERFIHVLSNAPPGHQARIIHGILEKYPPRDDARRSLADRLRTIASRLDGLVVAPVSVESPHAVIAQALADAEAAIASGRPASAIDRMHTVVHGYVRQLAGARNVALSSGATLPQAFAALWGADAALSAAHPDSKKIMRSLGAILESLSELRNNASPSHPNELVDAADAHLAINVARTILGYLRARFE